MSTTVGGKVCEWTEGPVELTFSPVYFGEPEDWPHKRVKCSGCGEEWKTTATPDEFANYDEVVKT